MDAKAAMRALTKSEARAWCIAHQVSLDERQLPQPGFPNEQGRDFKIPGDTGQRIALLGELFQSIPAGQEVLLWFSEWGVWPSSERPHMFERFRDSYGEHRWLSDAPAYLFSPAEREDLISFVGFGILFLWDCHLLTASADTWLFLSHDEVGWIFHSQSGSRRSPRRDVE
jgi:hypothetical protein